jgi:Predicted dehydrogenase
MSATVRDVAVVGGGIVGAATAVRLAERTRASVLLLEAEDRLAFHQTGHNSGVIHSGLYYRPGSRKAKLCVEGREALYRFCEARGVPHERCGKIVVATNPDEEQRLKELEIRGKKNGLEGLRRLGPMGIREIEPHATGLAGLFVAETGIVDFTAVVSSLADVLREAGGTIETGAGSGRSCPTGRASCSRRLAGSSVRGAS